MDVKQEIWAFALKHPDYWQMLRAEDTPVELEGLPKEDQDAFHAARAEFQRRLIALTTACIREFTTRARSTLFDAEWSWTPQRASILGNRVRASLPRHRAWLWVGTGPSDTGGVALWASIWVARKRYSDVRALLPGAQESNGMFHYVLRIDPSVDDHAMAVSFLDRFWEHLTRFQTSELGTLVEAEEAPPESGAGA